MDGQAIEQPAPDRQADNTVSVIMSAPVITIDADATLKEAELLVHRCLCRGQHCVDVFIVPRLVRRAALVGDMH